MVESVGRRRWLIGIPSILLKLMLIDDGDGRVAEQRGSLWLLLLVFMLLINILLLLVLLIRKLLQLLLTFTHHFDAIA